MAVRRVHAELAGVVAPLLRHVDAAGERHPQPLLLARRGVGLEAMEQPTRHVDVVALREHHVPEQRAQAAAAAVDVEQLVGVAVGDVDRIGRRRIHDAGDQVLVEQERHARVELRAARARELGAAIVPLREGATGELGGRGERCGPAVGGRREAMRVRPAQVIEDRVRAVEAVAREALLVAELAARSAQLRVVLARHLAELHAIDHGA